MTPDETASEQVHGQLINPKELNQKLSWGFCCLVERLMAKDPLHRYEDWTGVMADILAVKEGNLIKTPLASNIRSTVVHTRAPVPKGKTSGGKKIMRASRSRRGRPAQRRRGVSRGVEGGGVAPERRAPRAAGPIRQNGDTGGESTSGESTGSESTGSEFDETPSPPVHPRAPDGNVGVPYRRATSSLWPMVVGLGMVAGVLYLFTLSQVM